MEPLVSVIVPIYNVEKYLNKCVDSIINQTLENIEIILVDDGSTDSCGEIIDEYARKDNRIIVIHKENSGQSSARNMGLDIARGKYIGFVDSDDWIESNMYEDLYKSIEESNLDIAVCGRRAYTEGGKLLNEIEIDDELINFKNYKIKDYISNYLFYKHTVVVWNKLYKNKIIKNNNIRFENVSYVGSEDALFNYNIICHVNRIKCINRIYYNQLSREGSTARTYKYGYMNRTANMIECMKKYSMKTNNETIYKDVAPLFLLFFYQWNMHNTKSVTNNIKQLIFNEIKDASSNKVFMECIGDLVFNNSLNKNIRSMGFRLSGVIYIKLTMLLYYFNLYKLTTKMMILKP